MIYLDYSATTPTNKEVADSFYKACLDYPGNPNSMHYLGLAASKMIEKATEQIANLLKVKPSEIIYTSGASESNNTVIKGVASKYKNRGKHIITTEFEHSSIYGPLTYLQKEGFEVDFVKTDKNGIIDIENLKELLREDTILVTVASVNSEIGIRQPVEEIGKLLKKYPKCFFHVDMTQSIGKDNISFENIDFASFSAHKFYGIKGVGCLIKKEKIVLEPLIHGGKSTTIYRSGTPPLPLIVSTSKALRLALENLSEKIEKVKELNTYLKNNLEKYEGVYINSNEHCIPHILNVSIIGVKPEVMQHALEEDEIYISTKTACSKSGPSKGVLALTNDLERANSSIRISISSMTTKEEIDAFLKSFEKNLKKLMSLKKGSL